MLSVLLSGGFIGQAGVVYATEAQSKATTAPQTASPTAPEKAPVITEAMILQNQKDLIAHGGGAYNGYTHTNSLEALDNAYANGFRLIELDFYKTKETDGTGQYVLLHSEAYGTVFLGNAAADGVTFLEFTTLGRYPNLTQITANQLDQWLKTHPDVRIIGDKIRAADYIILGNAYSNLFKAMIPQVNSLEEYNSLKTYGYQDIIFTLYSTPYTADPSTIPALSKQVKLFALTMPYETVLLLSPDEIKQIQQDNPIYTHTINDLFQVNHLKSLGIKGYYSDYFNPNTFYLL